MSTQRPRVFTIPPSAPFLPTLISALRSGTLIPGYAPADDPLALASATIYLPTRRACRLLQSQFLDIVGADASLLPRLVPIGDIDEDEFVFAAETSPLIAAALDMLPAMNTLDRRLLLAQLILRWVRTGAPDPRDAALIAGTPASALALADALARLMDDMITRGASWALLDTLVPEDVDRYWQRTLDFLKWIRGAWPDLLAAHGAIEPAERRDRLIDAEAARLAVGARGPVIAAGSTASMPATARLLSAIARLPQGAVVLPGLDTALDDASWSLIASDQPDAPRAPEAGHPQFGMHAFLDGLGLRRDEVGELAAQTGRERLLSEALRPSASTDQWIARRSTLDSADALRDVAIIAAANPEEEALAIAVALRESAQSPGRTAALVTPDRTLARRVIAALRRWDVAVDDSGGDALSETPAGVFSRLVSEAALGGVEPVALLAMLKHPFCALPADGADLPFAVSALERAVLRGPRPSAGTSGLARALAAVQAAIDSKALHRADPRSRLNSRELAAAQALAASLQQALAPLEGLGRGEHAFADIAQRHRATLVNLGGETARDDASGADDVLTLLDEIATSEAAQHFRIRPSDYLGLFEETMAGRVLRQPSQAGTAVRILGLLEARLQHVDRIVLGGLVEGTWPPQARSDPWLSRPMRRTLGLDLPERRIGLTAHDFAQALGCREVFLAKADKVGGSPSVSSRFLQRLEAVTGKDTWTRARERGNHHIAWARALDRPAEVTPIRPPEPRPPLAARPTSLSVTEIEDWLRDPYGIYAKHVLKLRPLDAVDTPPGARDRGSAIHTAIEGFTRTFAERLPDDPRGALITIGEEAFRPLAEFQEARAFWWPRFQRIAEWFAQWETERRPGIDALLAEVSGELEIPIGDSMFRLRVRADRIERRTDGTYAILDYKTGRAASSKQVAIGLAPQLTLEGAILRRGGFSTIPPNGSISEYSYIQLRGGEPPGVPQPVGAKDKSADEMADEAYARLCVLIRRFADVEMPYRSLALSMWKSRYGDYDHLARVKEWSVIEDDEP